MTNPHDLGDDPKLLRALLAVLVRRATADGLQVHVSASELENLKGMSLDLRTDGAAQQFVLTVERGDPLFILAEGHA